MSVLFLDSKGCPSQIAIVQVGQHQKPGLTRKAQLKMVLSASISTMIGLEPAKASPIRNSRALKVGYRHPNPVFQEQGSSATGKEFLLKAEYHLSKGNPNAIVCEWGIRSFALATQNSPNLASIALLKERTQLPFIVLPNDAIGYHSLTQPTPWRTVGIDAYKANRKPERTAFDANLPVSVANLNHPITQTASQAIGPVAPKPAQCRIA